MIGGVAKSYNLTFDYVLYELSYANMLMYSAVLPQYSSPSKKDNKKTGISTGSLFEIMKKIK
jgi:hypothetical protein